MPLRLHLAELLLDNGSTDDAIAHVAAALQRSPGSTDARALMARAVGAPAAPVAPGPVVPESVGQEAVAPASEATTSSQAAGFDWASAERELSDVVPPRFVDDEQEDPGDQPAFDIESSSVRLADVAGMVEVKKRLQAAFLAPMNNPELRKLYGKSLRGGLLLYGPPGCGKTFIARAIAGELGAQFIAIGLNDVLDMWIGSSERNLHEVFSTARKAPVRDLPRRDRRAGPQTQPAAQQRDARRGQPAAHRARRRPRVQRRRLRARRDQPPVGRGRRAAAAGPVRPDAARAAAGHARAGGVLRYHLRDRPVAGIDTKTLAKRTHGYSGADLAHICETAAERALLDSVSTGKPRMIEMRDMVAALAEVKPSIGSWLNTARNVVEFSNVDGTYDDLRKYLKQERLL